MAVQEKPGGGDAQRRLIAYLRDCLLVDVGTRQVGDLQDRSERLQRYLPLPPEQWAAPPDIEVEPHAAKELLALLELQRQERELRFGSCLVMTPVRGDERRRGPVRAPLFLYDATLSQERAGWRLKVDAGSRRINTLVAQALELDPEALDGVSPDAVLGMLPAGLVELTADASSPGPFPDSRKPGWMPWGVYWAGSRSMLAATVAAELVEIMQAGALSPPVRRLLGDATVAAQPGRAAMPLALPVALTMAQASTLRNAASRVLSVVNGPPGTGKTYTLACQAIDRANVGESVLVVCGNEHAADVVHAQIAALLGDAKRLLVRGGRGSYRQELVARLEALLANGQAAPAGERPDAPIREARRLADQTRRFHDACVAAQGDVDRAAPAAVEWLLDGWRRWRVRRSPLLQEHWRRLHEERGRQQQRVKDHLVAEEQARLSAMAATRRAEIANLVAALRARSSGNRSQRFGRIDWNVLTKAFPIWVVSAQELSRALPLELGLFDLAILDEATQCSVPLALPALQRARRASVVGDPKQLRHYAFLSRRRQDMLAQKHGVLDATLAVDYRGQSVLDVAISAVDAPDAVVLLDEHFRSHPRLIAFSNRRFYDGRLKILTRARSGDRCFERIPCGVRLDGPVNLAEIDAVLERLQRIVESSRGLADVECPRLGVMALFRHTAEALERALVERMELQAISRHAMRVGTPYSFQGDERDIVLMATGLYPGRARAAWTYLQREDVFNVAVTRARRELLLFVPAGTLEQQPDSLLANYVDQMERDDASPNAAGLSFVADDAFATEVGAALRGWDLTIQHDVPFAAESLDLAVLHGDNVTAIDLIGGPSGRGKAWSPARYRQLERAGIDVFPLSWMEWRVRRADVMARFESLFGLPAPRSPGAGAIHAEATRARLLALGDARLLGLHDRLVAGQRAVTSRINDRFGEDGLTAARYRQAVARVVQAASHELDGATRLLESARELGDSGFITSVEGELHRRLLGCGQAADRLQQLDAALESLPMEAPELDDALVELGELVQRVPLYARPGADSGTRASP